MALTRKLLSALGIEAEKIDEIIGAHTDTIEGLKDELAKVKADAAKLPEVQKELDDLKAKPDDGWKDKYDAARKELADYKDSVAKEKALAAKKAAYQELCKDAGLSENGITKAVKYADFDSVELDDAGKIKDGKSLIKSIREEWPEHIVKDSTSGARTPTPPAGTGGKTYQSKDEIIAIKDQAERQKAILDNHELFGI